MGTYDPQAPLACLSDEILVEIFSYLIEDEQVFITSKTFKSDAFKSGFPFNFVSKYMSRLTSKSGEGRRVGGIYLEELGKHVVKNVALVVVNIKDLKFANLEKFIDTLKQYNKLAEFDRDSNGDPIHRRIMLVHRTSYRFPTEPKSLTKLNKHLKTTCPDKHLYLGHVVIRIEDLAPVNAFIQAVRFRDTIEGQLVSFPQALMGKISDDIIQIQNQKAEEERVAARMA